MDLLDRAPPGLDVAVVERRPGEDDPAHLARPRPAIAQEALPGKGGIAPVEGRIDGPGNGPKGLVERAGRDLASDHALGEEVKGVEHAPWTRVGCQRAQHRLRRYHGVGERLNLPQRKKEHPVLPEESAGRRLADVLEQAAVRREPRGQRRGGVLRLVRCVAVDHNGEQVDVLGERLVQLGRGAAPRQVRRDEVRGVGVDRDAPGDVKAGCSRRQQRKGRYCNGVTPAGPHQADNRPYHTRVCNHERDSGAVFRDRRRRF